MPRPPIAADLDEALDVHRDLLPEIALDAALLFDDVADLAHVLFGEVLHPDVRADAGTREDVVRPLPADAVDVGQPDFYPLGSRKIDACDTSHSLLSVSLAAACVSDSHRSRAPRRRGARSCTCRKSALLTHEPS